MQLIIIHGQPMVQAFISFISFQGDDELLLFLLDTEGVASRIEIQLLFAALLNQVPEVFFLVP